MKDNNKLRFYNRPYEEVFSEGFYISETPTFFVKKVKDWTMGTDVVHRTFEDFKGRGKVDFLTRQIPAELSPFYIPKEVPKGNLTEHQVKDKTYFEEYWPIRKDPYLTFSTYLFGNHTELKDRMVLAVDRIEFEHTDLFSDPIRFASYADAAGIALVRFWENQQLSIGDTFAEDEDRMFFPECEKGYIPVSAWMNNASRNDKSGFAAYRENTIHCLKEDVT